MRTAWQLCRLLVQVLVLLPVAVSAAKDNKKQASQPQRNVTIDRLVNLRTHSIYAPYIDQDLQNRWWDFGADAYVNTNKHIRLTRARRSQMGWLWSRLPISVQDYVIEVDFKIYSEVSSHLHGDGLAIWLTQERTEPGPVFGNRDKFTGLGIFLDTYANSRHSYSFPRVTAMLGDGNTNYDHDHDGEANNIGACSVNYRRSNMDTKVRIAFIKNAYLDVKLQYKAWDDWTDCFRVNNFSMPASPYLGFSALTGDVFDTHDIVSVTTSIAILGDNDQAPDKPHASSSTVSGSWFVFILKVFLFFGVCAGVLYGYKEYKKMNNGYGGFQRGVGLDMPWSNGKRF